MYEPYLVSVQVKSFLFSPNREWVYSGSIYHFYKLTPHVLLRRMYLPGTSIDTTSLFKSVFWFELQFLIYDFVRTVPYYHCSRYLVPYRYLGAPFFTIPWSHKSGTRKISILQTILRTSSEHTRCRHPFILHKHKKRNKHSW